MRAPRFDKTAPRFWTAKPPEGRGAQRRVNPSALKVTLSPHTRAFFVSGWGRCPMRAPRFDKTASRFWTAKPPAGRGASRRVNPSGSMITTSPHTRAFFVFGWGRCRMRAPRFDKTAPRFWTAKPPEGRGASRRVNPSGLKITTSPHTRAFFVSGWGRV